MRQAPPRRPGQESLPGGMDLLNAVNAGVLALDAETGALLAAGAVRVIAHMSELPALLG